MAETNHFFPFSCVSVIYVMFYPNNHRNKVIKSNYQFLLYNINLKSYEPRYHLVLQGDQKPLKKSRDLWDYQYFISWLEFACAPSCTSWQTPSRHIWLTYACQTGAQFDSSVLGWTVTLGPSEMIRFIPILKLPSMTSTLNFETYKSHCLQQIWQEIRSQI